MRKALVVGGANGIGLSIATLLAADSRFEKVYIVDRANVAEEFVHPKFECHNFDLCSEDYSFFDKFSDIDTLMITAGFGRLSHFADIDEAHIINSFNVNTTAVVRLIHHFYSKISAKEDFFTAVMGASKAALKIFIESVNVELEMAGTTNRILNISPGSIKGTAFYNGKNDLSLTEGLARDIISRMEAKDDLFIPMYDEVFKEVLARYAADFRAEGRHSYEYKMQSGRIK